MTSSSVPMGRNQKVVIIGGGPTGLGAATRLAQLGHDNWELLEASGEMGGLAGSVVDEQGFTWDLGGHVIFSHYKYFDELTSSAVDEWYTHQRESWVWIEDRWVPYPFQNNIHRLSNESKQKCLEGLIKAAERRLAHEKPRNFQEWIDQRFGPGLADLFMNPYNYKVWGIRPSGMSAQWMGERVALVDLPRVTNNVVHNKDDLSWGPNAIFKFPGHGGTGEIWKRVARRLPQEKLKLNAALVSIDFESKQITLQDGSKVSYDTLISTMPIDKLIQASNGHDDWKAKSAGFVHSATHIIGIGLAGTPPPHLQGKCWMYFPEANCPFYRVTLFSHYSPNHVPKVEIPPGAAAEDSNPAGFWSLMLEVCESDNKPLPEGYDIVQLSVEGLLNTKLITKDDKIVSKWHKRLEYGYPTPFVGRDELLAELQPKLEALGVFSRGRFGGWKYEVGNQDHSLMQGVEVADRILLGIEEETYNYPDLVNGRKVTSRFYGNGQRLF